MNSEEPNTNIFNSKDVIDFCLPTHFFIENSHFLSDEEIRAALRIERRLKHEAQRVLKLNKKKKNIWTN